ncbi:RHS repeat-associated core domain-containing protein [Pseudomonas sp. KNUC1026]|uniref:RHS repeat-associated core domain-containing protein n=1 Tax=Pseudomonas sp. KNUC1026 TaxID=2893890 RepID=UPI001F24376E|nr:RHS repeat-associated core domain-containing protein [Pseudomonas sp. KNUC1026]UFH48881.1 hypothetical protein LN139_18195 [Pseudomonas sp. KNUC1026]
MKTQHQTTYFVKVDPQCTSIHGKFTPFGFTGHAHRALTFASIRVQAADSIYPLGNGFRIYSPSLQRILQPDSTGPFRAALNSYVYCEQDPVNRQDPSGRNSIFNWLYRKGARLWAGKYKTGTKISATEHLEMGEALSDLWISPKKVGAPRLIDRQSSELAFDLGNFQSHNTLINLHSASEFKKLKIKTTRKFTYHDSYDFLVLKEHDDSVTHAVIGHHSASPVISAGYLTRVSESSWEISNHSGHFLPGLDTLEWVRDHIIGLGFKAEIRGY